MTLTTNFNLNPYFDDFDESKNFHRVLFKPAVAVQARELTQLQTILQNQIERFGNSIYKDGSIVEGCGITFLPTMSFARLQDHDTNGNLLVVDNLVDSIVENENGLQARVLTVKTGSEVSYPLTNRVYVAYTTTGNNDTKSFAGSDTLTFYATPRSSNNILATATVIANSANVYSGGAAVGMKVSDGVVYQKGFFVRVDPQTTVVSDFFPFANTVVGFVTNESIINSDQDESLLDNALGYENANAPGADRLKLTANLMPVLESDLGKNPNFNPIAHYVLGNPVIEDQNPLYSTIGDKMAKDNDDAHGSFVIKPFTIDTVPHTSNSALLQARVSPGSGYVNGYKVELIKTAPVDVRRGVDTAGADAQLITTNYANYLTVTEFAGTFDFTKCEDVELWSAAQTVVTNHSAVSATAGVKIGVASIRSVDYLSGTPGTPTATYAIYLYNIRMNSGHAFSEVKSLYSNNTTKGVADVVGNAVLANSERRGMIWSFGKSALKSLTDSNGANHTQYVFRQKTTTTLAIDGTAPLTISASHGTGTNEFAQGVGVVGDANEAGYIVVALSSGQTNNMVGTVTLANTTVTGVGTSFSTHFSVGEYINIIGAGAPRRVTAIANNTSLTLDASATNVSGANYTKYFPAGYVFPLTDSMVGTRNVNITSSTTATVNTGIAVTGQSLQATIPLAVYHNVIRYNTLPAAKVINKGVLVQIDPSTNPGGYTGPWYLGFSDVHKVTNVYVGANTYSTSSPDQMSNFIFDTGQTDTHYDTAKLRLRTGALSGDQKILVQLDVFTPNMSPGVGFYTVGSYPVDDSNTANTNAITTEEIPVYVSETGGTYALRDSVDFRPHKTNTATLTTSLASATTNPIQSNSFVVDTVGTYVPAANENFEASIQYYLGRRDIVYITSDGFLRVREGVSSEYPIAPTSPSDGMPISLINIPPYPSLTATEKADVVATNRTTPTTIRDITGVGVSIVTNRRYTMKDIHQLDNRISRLEYYMSLSLLEKAATDLQIPDSNGLDRFKNGIFVDPFSTHLLGDVGNMEYKIAIDEQNGIARPFIDRHTAELDYLTTSTTYRTGRVLTLPYTRENHLTQPYATKYRNAAPAAYLWNGFLQLFPNYDNNVDTVNAAAVTVTMDLAAAWDQFANSPFGTLYGDWRVTGSTSSSYVSGGGSSVDSTGGVSSWTDYTTTTDTTSSRTNTGISVGATNTTYNLGSYISDVSVLPYIRSREVAFKAWGLRPNTKVYAFFDKVNVSTYCAPGVASGVNDTSSDNMVTRTTAWGTQLVTDANGVVYGKFVVPDGQFRTGEREFRVADVTSLAQGGGAYTTTASATYTASSYAVTKTGVTLTAVNPDLTFTSMTDKKTTTSSSTSSSYSYIPGPPPPPVVYPDPPVNPPPPDVQPPPPGPVGPVWTPPDNTQPPPPPDVQPPNPTVTPPPPNPVVDVFPPVTPPPPVVQPPQPPTVWYDPGWGTDSTFEGLDVWGNNFGGYGQAAAPVDPNSLSYGWEGAMDPIAQAFTITAPQGTSGVFMSDVEVYFKKKPDANNLGVTVYITETVNGYPDSTEALPYSRVHLNWSDIKVSDDASLSTKFTFEAPVYLADGVQYAYLVMPDGGDPDYLVWFATLGDQDVATGATVFSQPSTDTAFLSANNRGWTALQNEYMKFKLNRTVFTSPTATANFQNVGVDYFKIGGLTYNGANTVMVGDYLVAAQSATAGYVNGSMSGCVEFIDPDKGIVYVSQSTGKFAYMNDWNYTHVQFHRLLPGGTMSASTWIAGAPFIALFDPVLNAVVPRFATALPVGTSLTTNFSSTYDDYSRTPYSAVPLDTETEFFEAERKLVSYSNEQRYMGQSSATVAVTFTSENPFVSPVIDLSRANILAIANLIDPTTHDFTNEYYNTGDAQTKYISKTVVLADGQDSEDLQVYLTAYRPTSSDIRVYAKFLSSDDPQKINDKNWTLLSIDNDTVYSDYRNTSDYREYLFTVPSTLPAGTPNAGYVDATNGLTYTDASGAKHTTYKQFAIKIVLCSDSTARVPRLNDVRAVALLT